MNRLLVLDDDDHLHQALHRILHGQDVKMQIHQVGTAEECADRLLHHDYTAVLINVSHLQMPRSLGLVRELNTNYPQINVLVFGITFTKQELLDLIEAGTSAYLRGPASAEKILETLNKVEEGRFPICPDITAAVMRRIAQLAGYRIPTAAVADGNGSGLTRRQNEVLQLIRQGMSNAEIASNLCIEIGTVKNHVHNVLQKLDASDRHEAANKAYLVPEERAPVGS